MSRTFICVLCTMFLFMGMVLGFLLSPIKGGIHCGNNNGNCTQIPLDEMEV